MNGDGKQKYPHPSEQSSINDSSHPNENATTTTVESEEAQSLSVDGPLPMNRTLSTPANTASGEELKQDYPLLLQRSASSAFGRFATNRTRTFSNSGSDTGSTGSAFHPVWSYRSVTSASSICSSSETGSNVSSIVKSAHSDPTTGTGEGRSRFSSPWRKVMNKMKNSSSNKAAFRRTLSGRENPAMPALCDDDRKVSSGSAPAKATPGKVASPASSKATTKTKPKTDTESHSSHLSSTKETIIDQKRYEDPGVALDLSDDSDSDYDLEPIMGGNLNPADTIGPCTTIDEQKCRPSVEIDPSIEVVSTIYGTKQTPIKDGTITDIGPSGVHIISPPPPYHPPGTEEASKSAQQKSLLFKYRSPQRSSQSPNSKLSSKDNSPSSVSARSPESRISGMNVIGNASLASSPQSRISSSTSRSHASGERSVTTLSSGEGSLVVDGADSEVRNANKCPSRRSIGCGTDKFRGTIAGISSIESTIDADGNATVFSSSTGTSAYNAHSIASPRPGASMAPQSLFPSGNVAWSPNSATRVQSCQSTVTVDSVTTSTAGLSRFISLSPKSVGKKASLGGGGREGTHSPHTTSSNSTSSGSDKQKPLRFVEYGVQTDEERESPFDEPPVAAKLDFGGSREDRETVRGSTRGALIKPRISRNHMRPPIQVRHGNKPPQSPRKQDRSGARAPSTPPPGFYQTSGATTPSSPPEIVCGPGELVSGIDSRARPSVVRHPKTMILIPPSTKGANHGSENVVSLSPSRTSRRGGGWKNNISVVSPDKL